MSDVWEILFWWMWGVGIFMWLWVWLVVGNG